MQACVFSFFCTVSFYIEKEFSDFLAAFEFTETWEGPTQAQRSSSSNEDVMATEQQVKTQRLAAL